MNINWCWHRPGRRSGRFTICRHCFVAVEECVCGPQKRNEDPCRCCEGSGWVATILSRRAALDQTVPTGVAG